MNRSEGIMDPKNTKNLGLTKQRHVVLRVIQGAHEHLTANEVFGAAKELLPSISFATVYNSLRFLKDAGHIAEICFGNGASRYDRMTHRHDHAICTSCGKLADIEMEVPSEILKKAAKQSKFKPESLEFTLRGKCPECVDRN
jgi:Fe2+ or Zn2+ uptake regulation protein